MEYCEPGSDTVTLQWRGDRLRRRGDLGAPALPSAPDVEFGAGEPADPLPRQAAV